MAVNPTHGTFEDITAGLDPKLTLICIALKKLITSCHQGFVEIAWKNQRIASYGVGPRKMSDHYSYINPHKRHVNLGFYHGAILSDSMGLLEGSGKRLRHIKIMNSSELENPEIKCLIIEAINDRKES